MYINKLYWRCNRFILVLPLYSEKIFSTLKLLNQIKPIDRKSDFVKSWSSFQQTYGLACQFIEVKQFYRAANWRNPRFDSMVCNLLGLNQSEANLVPHAEAVKKVTQS